MNLILDPTVFIILAAVGAIIFAFLQILMAAFAARDATARGMDSPALWALIVLLFPIIGFLVYVFTMPHGVMVPCSRCANPRLSHLSRCPHCGYEETAQ
ncbi:MAG: hypothetical protein GC154_12250 [bacterium]|nr:hypothetical protein [bacterium]